MAPKCAANRACSYVCRFYWTNIWVHRVHRVQPVFVNTPNCDNMGYCSLRVTHRQSQEITWNNKEQLRTLNTTKALKMRAFVVVYPNCSKLFIISYLPTQNLLSDAEVTICKYKWLIISTNTFVLGYLK